MSAVRSSPPIWKKFLFTFVVLFFLLAASESFVRVKRGRLFDFQDVRQPLPRVQPESRYVRHDPLLGYAPMPGFRGTCFGDKTVTITPDAVRSNGAAPPAGGAQILAVGDSFTFGGQVHDHETWPAQLEKITGRPVLNGGVSGYGWDQTVLRAEQLVPRHRPAQLIASLITTDVQRAELSRRNSSYKPYFDIEDGTLRLKNVPVPPPPENTRKPPNLFKTILGHSHLADEILDKHFKNWWSLDVTGVQEHRQGKQVARLLVDRLAKLCKQHECQLLILIQSRRSGGDLRLVAPMIERARSLDVPVINLIPTIQQLIRQDPQIKTRFFDGHMTAEGNEWVARQLAEKLNVEG